MLADVYVDRASLKLCVCRCFLALCSKTHSFGLFLPLTSYDITSVGRVHIKDTQLRPFCLAYLIRPFRSSRVIDIPAPPLFLTTGLPPSPPRFRKPKVSITAASDPGPLNIEEYPGAEMLANKEKELCGALRMLPKHYLFLKVCGGTEEMGILSVA